MKTSQGTGSKGGQVGSGRRLKSPDTTMRWPLYASTACAEPRMWPAGTRLHIDVADPHAFAIFQRLLVGVGHILEAGAHDRQRFGRGERRPMAGPGMVAMAMGDHGARHGDGRIDIEVAGLAVEAARRRIEARSGDLGCRLPLSLLHPTQRYGLPGL